MIELMLLCSPRCLKKVIVGSRFSATMRLKKEQVKQAIFLVKMNIVYGKNDYKKGDLYKIIKRGAVRNGEYLEVHTHHFFSDDVVFQVDYLLTKQEGLTLLQYLNVKYQHHGSK